MYTRTLEAGIKFENSMIDKGPSIKYVNIELGQSTAEGTCQSQCGICGINPHGHQQVPSALGKYSLETKLEMKY